MSEESHTHGARAGRKQVRPARSVGDLGGQPRGDAREALEQGGSGRGGRGIMLFLSGDHEEEGQWPSGVPSQPASLRLGPVLQPSGTLCLQPPKGSRAWRNGLPGKHIIFHCPEGFRAWRNDSESQLVASDSLRHHRLHSPWNSPRLENRTSTLRSDREQEGQRTVWSLRRRL